MKIEVAVVEELVREAERFQQAAIVPADCGRIDVDRELTQLRLRLRCEIQEQLQPWFVLLDESIQYFVQFERFLYEVSLSRTLTAYAVTVSKLKRDVISIRELLAIGQDMAARVLARTFVEDIEIAMALALSPETCEAFSATSDTNEFWNRHIGYGRVYDKIRDYLLACGVEETRTDLLVERHRDAKKMFSETTHGGRNSAVMSAFPPSLSDRSQVHFLSLGAVTYATAELALFVAQEAHAFAGSVVKGTLQTRPLHLFEEFEVTGRHMNAVSSAYVLQELLAKYEGALEAKIGSF